MNQKKCVKQIEKARSTKKLTTEFSFAVDPKIKVSTAFINDVMVGYCPEGKEKEFSEEIHDVITKYKEMCLKVMKQKG